MKYRKEAYHAKNYQLCPFTAQPSSAGSFNKQFRRKVSLCIPSILQYPGCHASAKTDL